MSLITLIDDKRQWFKAAKGINDTETLREDSFCQHALNKPKEVLIVDDPLNDERFKNNRYVLGDPNIRFYAGAPLETPTGNVLGTLCIIDNKPRELSEAQKRGLQLLAKKAMDFLNARKLLFEQGEQLQDNARRLRKLTNHAPGCIFQFEMDGDGEWFVHFVSEGIKKLHPQLTPEGLKNRDVAIFHLIHDADRMRILEMLHSSYSNLSDIDFEFRMASGVNDEFLWYWAKASPEKIGSGNLMWYGILQDISNRKSYERALEQMSFDISHVLRRPVTTMLGLANIIEKEDLSKESMVEYVGYIKVVSQEMDNFTRKLNEIYYDKQQQLRNSR